MMSFHAIETIEEPILFRRMRVESGFLYNFYNYRKNRYSKRWVFVPDSSQQLVIKGGYVSPENNSMPVGNPDYIVTEL